MTGSATPPLSTRLLALAAMRCHPGAPRLSPDELQEHLSILSGWTFADNRIGRTFSFANYYETMAFANAVAFIAHREDHHPDLGVGKPRPPHLPPRLRRLR